MRTAKLVGMRVDVRASAGDTTNAASAPLSTSAPTAADNDDTFLRNIPKPPA
jgi:hypothetical protein